jgi:16S rRNA (adenine1518-N6/adenine1519-N6)-dimethyltransferase
LVPARLHHLFGQVVRAAFGTRRKTLANALSHADGLGLSKGDAKSILSESGIESSLRAEDLSADAFLRLAEAVGACKGAGDRLGL